jgi:hypothetical protein
VSGRRRRSGDAGQDHRRSAWAELDIDGRLSAYAQAQQSAEAHGVHLRGKEALERFHGLQQRVRADFDAEHARTKPGGGSARRWVLAILALVVLGALAAVVLSA